MENLNLENVELQAEQELATVNDLVTLGQIKANYLGKKGLIASLMANLRDLPVEAKKELGMKSNQIKVALEAKFEAKRKAIEEDIINQKLKSETIDVTLPAKANGLGNLHPLTCIRNEIIDVFAGMGFDVFDGPEIEDDDHNFTRLNVLKDHPSRDMQDTFWLTDELLLRTHTSPGQIRVMDNQAPPIKVLMPGKVFRSDSDATHSPMFSQMEGLVVDEHITLCDLQGMLDQFVKALFSDEVKTRLRPSYFPFTEPSVEVDVSCFKCGGAGCSLCKGTGWIEVLGGGIVNNNVLENCNVDSGKYSGLAFGIGIERIAMLKYGINHMGKLFENDIEFLKQFKA